MECKQPAMAHRKRQGTSSGMVEPRVRPCPAASAALDKEEEPEQEDLQAPEQQFHQEVSDLKDSRPPTPEPTDQECHDHSGDEDSSSDYVNNTSEEEDYDEGLPEEDEGVTYYIRYCPEDDSYLEGMDCNDGEYVNHEEQPLETDECQEAVEEWAESEGQGQVLSETAEEQIYEEDQDQGLGDHEPSMQTPLPGDEDKATEEEDEEEEEEEDDYCPNEESYPHDYYAPETNGNSVCVSPYQARKGGGEGEDQEEDIDQIVAEIKMSMSMGSISSDTDQSPEEPGIETGSKDFKDVALKADPVPYTRSRHEGRPKSLNIPQASRHSAEIQRGFKVRARTPEERQKWAQEQVCHNPDQPRKQQRSDLNGPAENNNIPEKAKKTASFPSFVDVNSIVGEWLGLDLKPGPPAPLSSAMTTRPHSLHLKIPGPCEPEDLIDGIIFAANYLGSTQLLSERNPSKNIRMMQAQEAVSRVKRVQKAAKIKKKATPEGDAQTLTEVDLFISTQRIKVLNADSQETMMDNALRTISYIADIGNIVVLMARRRMPRTASQDCIETTPGAQESKKQYKMICHVFESEDAQLIAQSIGQAFSVAYQEFLRANGINPEDLSQKEYSDIINTQEMYNDDLIHFSNSENCKELELEKQKGEILGVVIVESGWGSILPTVILANMMNAGPAARSGKLSIGDQIMSINGTSLVGLPLATCQGIIKGLKNQIQVKLNIVSCPPVTTVLIKRPDLKYQLGFSVQNGIICSLMRGGIAERGGVRVGHRIIEINGQSVVATAHEKIVQALSNSVGEIHMKTMPAAMFRLLTGQETPIYI
ncbi:amyloid-beta A4 precursor protein-binding family A member 2 isoform X2 [Acipenser ruthenus]|uniref:amyloid-beta A4 precursor protein-binding family A member 2 isoform X2 n=1 Tax=Acipenser ruthenus TaxID=7906 RepID=UPI00145ADACD|nr:amyloid-beta A4 precursor protein-binding family A member 2 isoform X2 [Acipenser ruthenus]